MEDQVNKSLYGEKMKVKLQLFGAFRKYGNEINIDLPLGSIVSDLRPKLLDIISDDDKAFDTKSLIDTSRFANDEEVLEESSVINDNDVLAILPPVSGG